MKHVCLNCEGAEMTHGARDVTVTHHGFKTVVRRLHGWHCPNCGEIEFDKSKAQRYIEALERLEAQERAWLSSTRKKLKLTQREAAVLTGGGHNAFSRYERGEAKPVVAVVNLFRLLEKRPELLKELQRAS
jgi:HTH-type transcriptional regulator/antitoxin MqsA